MGDSDKVIANMRGRIEQCRRLARSINDASAIEVLLKMAQDIEADVKRLEAKAKRGPTSRVRPTAPEHLPS